MPLEFYLRESCPVCENKEIRKGENRFENMGVCPNCGCVFFIRIPMQEISAPGDSGDYYLSERYHKEKALQAWRPRVKQLLALLDPDKKLSTINVLEIGCGLGFLLKAFQEEGCQVLGTELSQSCITFAREVLHIKVLHADEFSVLLDDYKEYFDLVITYHVLEHLLFPNSMKKMVEYVLRKGGIWSIEVPNILSFESLWLQSEWKGLSYPAHKTFLTEKTFPLFLSPEFIILSMQTSVSFLFYEKIEEYLRFLTCNDSFYIAKFASLISGTNIQVEARKVS
jgi:SAM-dependent methyltransferase